MTRQDRVRYEMFSRVRQFGNTHGKSFEKTSLGGRTFATVAAAVADMEQYAKAKVRTSGAGREARARAREAIVEQLTDIARTARLVGTKVSGGADKAFEVPQWRSDAGLLTAARAVIEDGRAAADVLVQLGLPATFVDDLQARVDRFAEADRGRQAGRLGLAAARAGLATAMAQATDADQTLDVIVANTFKHDATVLAEWEAARHWKARRTSTSKTTAETPEPAPVAMITPPPAPSASAPPEPQPAATPAAGDTPAKETEPEDPALRKAS